VEKGLTQLVDSGHCDGGYIDRVIGGELKRYSTFAPMALAAVSGITIFPIAVMDRGIILALQRGTRKRKRFNLKNPDIVDEINWLYGQVWQWARSNPDLDPEPPLPAELDDRAQDNWRVLISIADSFGETWGERAREAAVALSREYSAADAGVTALAHSRDIFDATSANALLSKQLIAALRAIEDGPWNEWRGPNNKRSPHALTQGDLAELLAAFEIFPRTVWPPDRKEGGKSGRGYRREQFESAWGRYCPSRPDAPDDTTTQMSKIRRLRDA
jgi:Protein of unknown function (DUF3631)